MEFFIFFFDLIAKDLLEAIEETCIKGEVIKSLNSTFIALIPKVNGLANFGDFWSIALCNFCYKVISKIIANRLRPILSRALSEEQFGFLKGRQINEASGIAQECLHNIKEKKLQALILEIDLRKAYDCISWDFLRLVLLQCGFGLLTTNWIMGCVFRRLLSRSLSTERPRISSAVGGDSGRDARCRHSLSLLWRV